MLRFKKNKGAKYLKRKKTQQGFFFPSNIQIYMQKLHLLIVSYFAKSFIPLSKWFAIIESNLSVKMPLTDIDYF